jgi:hypothetical protein
MTRVRTIGLLAILITVVMALQPAAAAPAYVNGVEGIKAASLPPPASTGGCTTPITLPIRKSMTAATR